jgi:hypothetical protein
MKDFLRILSAWCLLGIFAAAASDEAIYEFSPASDLKKLQTAGATCEIACPPESADSNWGKITIRRYDGSGTHWPAVVFPAAALLRSDWNQADAVCFEAYAPQDMALTMRMTFTDAGKPTNIYQYLNLKKGLNQVVVPASVLTRAPVRQLEDLHFFQEDPKTDAVVYLRNLRLVLAEKDDGRTILKFASAIDAAKVRVKPGTKMTVCPWPEKQPGWCAQVMLLAFRPGGDQWPGVILPAESLRNKDLSLAGSFVFDAFAPEQTTVSLLLAFSGKDKPQKFYYQFKLKKGFQQIAVPRSVFESAKGNLTEIHFFADSPASEIKFCFGNLRMGDAAAAKVTATEAVPPLRQPHPVVAGGQTPLFDFEQSADTAKFNVRADTELAVTAWPDGVGGYCGKLTFFPYKGGENRWPAAVFDDKILAFNDLRGVKELQFDAFAAAPVNFSIRLSFPGNGKIIQKFFPVILQTGRNTVTIPRYYFADVPQPQLLDIHFFQEMPATRSTLYFGKLRASLMDATDELAILRRQDAYLNPADFDSLPGTAAAASQNQLAECRQLLQTLKPDLKFPSAAEFVAIEKIGKMQETLLTARSEAVMLKNAFPEYCWGFVPAQARVMRENPMFPLPPQNIGRIAAARGETEGVQLALQARQNLTGLQVNVTGDLVNDRGDKLDKANLLVAPIGYVLCGKPSAYPVKRTGYWPDPVLTYAKKIDLSAKSYQGYLLEAKIPERQTAGVYHGEVVVKADGLPEHKLPLEIRVFNFNLPDGEPYPLAVSIGETRLDGFPAGVEAIKAYKQQCVDLYLAHRINPDSLYHGTPPSVESVKYRLDRGGKMFNIMYVNCRDNELENGKFPEARRKQILEKLDKAIPEYRAAGILDKAVIYAFDEAGDARFRAIKEILGEIRQRYPGIPIITTAYDFSLGTATGLDSVVDIWTPLTEKYDRMSEAITQARQRGRKVFWYVCISPHRPYANLYIEYPTLDGRQLTGFMTWQGKPDGFLYYSLALWQDITVQPDGSLKYALRKNPMRGAPLTDWAGSSWIDNNGDGTLAYPAENGPIPSMRLKAMRDGLEDYHYMLLLNTAVQDAKSGKVKMPDAWLQASRSALKVNPEVVTSLTVFSTTPETLLAERQKIAELIEQYENNKAR